MGGPDTLLVFPFNELESIVKKKKRFFDNCIEFQAVSGLYLFTSFINRDRAFDIIKEYRNYYIKL